ncbi:MAG: site-specific integrase [archaeon]
MSALLGSDTPRRDVYSLTKHELEEAIKTLSDVARRKYGRSGKPKYGTLSKAFSQKELDLFFANCANKKALLAFRAMAFLGLRVGEVVDMKMEDIDPQRNIIYIRTEKARTLDALYIHDKIRADLYEWVERNRQKIADSDGYVFFSCQKDRKCISPHWLRKEFRETTEKIGIADTYGTSQETDPDRAQRKLHRLTTHSLRHYFITRVYAKTKNPIHTQKLARHLDFKSTQVYIHNDPKEVHKSMKSVFEEEQNVELEEFMEAFRMWKRK